MKEVYGAFETDLRQSLDQGHREMASQEQVGRPDSPPAALPGWEMRKKVVLVRV